MAEVVLSECTRIGHLRLSNVAKRNAMTLEMWRQLQVAVHELDRSADTRVIVISGDGDRAFASGADIGTFTAIQEGSLSLENFVETVFGATAAIRAAKKPVVASIRGSCMGAGMEIAAACDVRFASTDARFGMPAALIGLGVQKEIVREFVHLMGRANAADVLLSARTFDATEAQRMGFVNQVLDPAKLDDTVRAYSQALCANAPLTLRAAKVALGSVCTSGAEAPELEYEADRLVAQCYESRDFSEGRKAFFEKRRPAFTGR